MPNPEYYDRQRQRRSTWNIPRYLQSYDETLEGNLILPRGLRPLLTQLVESAGSALKFEDRRSSGLPQQFDCAVQLRPEQQRAVEALDQVEQGILVAPPGVGKTVMACSVIALRQVSTLILVDRKALADQCGTGSESILTWCAAR